MGAQGKFSLPVEKVLSIILSIAFPIHNLLPLRLKQVGIREKPRET